MNMKRHGQFWFLKTAATTALLVFFFAGTGRAAPGVSNRYLFLIDTSFSMTRIDTPVRNAVGEMIREGLGGRMKTGDTFGLWTFNEHTHTDFPLQTWDGDGTHRDVLAILAEMHLKKMHFEKTTRLDRIWPEVADVIQSAGDVTVFLLSDGDAPLQGTPFDAEINAAWEKIARDQHRARKPIVTTLVAREGKIVRWAINSPTELFVMPAIPTPKIALIPPVKIEKPAPVAVVTPPPIVKPAPKKVEPPAIVENKTPPPAPVAVVVPPIEKPVVVAPPKLAAVEKPIVVEKPPLLEKPVVEAKPVEIKPPVNPPAPVVTPPVAVVATPVVPPPAVVPVKSELPKPVVEIKPPAPAPIVEAPKEIIVAKTVVPETPKVATLPPTPPAPKPAQQVVTTVTPAPVVENKTPAPIVVATPVVPPSPPVAVEKKPEPVKPAMESKPPVPAPVVAEKKPEPPKAVVDITTLCPGPVVEVQKKITVAKTVVTLPEARFNSRGMLIMGGVLLGAASLMVLLLARRSRTPQPSLISRSMDKQ